MNLLKQNEIGSTIVTCAAAFHRETGPGLLETVYEAVLARDWEARGLRAARQVPIPHRASQAPVRRRVLCGPHRGGRRSRETQIRGEGHKGAPLGGVDLSAVDGYQTRQSTRLRRDFDEGRQSPHHKRRRRADSASVQALFPPCPLCLCVSFPNRRVIRRFGAHILRCVLGAGSCTIQPHAERRIHNRFTKSGAVLGCVRAGAGGAPGPFLDHARQ